MFVTKWKIVVAVALLTPAFARAGDQKEQQAYCSYVMEQAQAQRDLLRTPTATAGFTQPETGLPIQVVGGASLGLSDVKKAGLTMEVARRNCELYKAETGAQQEIQYAVPNLEKEALSNRLTLIDRASTSLDALMEQTSKMVEAQNATRVMLFSLQTTKIKLNADRADTQTKLTAIYIPPLSGQPLKDLVSQKQSREAGAQKAENKLTRQNNWDVVLTVGVHQQVNPVAQNPQPYGLVSVNYNLASRAINKHLDSATAAHAEWKQTQESDVTRGMEVLRQQLADGVTVQEARLKSLQEQSDEIKKNLDLVATPDTSAAFDFHNQLAAAQLLLEIEAGDASFRIDLLREFLAQNY
jgi:hypothetical protein